MPKLAAADGDGFDWFANAIAVSDDGTTAIIGAYQNEHPNGEGERGNGAGSAYVYSL